MILDQNKPDDSDKVCLIGAMMVANDLASRLPEGEVSRIQVAEVGDFYTAALRALNAVAILHRESPDEFDGVVWYERLVDASEGSLADRLVEMLISDLPTKEAVRKVVVGWLTDSGL